MKIIVVLLNVIAILTCIFNITESYFDKDDFFSLACGAFWFLLLCVIAIINMIFIIKFKGSGWLSLYFKRKELEEKKKIQNLKKDLTL